MESHLYAHMLNASKNFKMPNDKLTNLLNRTSELPLSHANTLYILILHHYYLENPKVKCKGLPYAGRRVVGKKGFIWQMDVEKLSKESPTLTRIIGYYLSKVIVIE
jgi:hypothetical protein